MANSVMVNGVDCSPDAIAALRERLAEVEKSNTDRRDGNLIFLSQLHSAMDRADLSNHNEGILTRLVRIIDRLLAAESRLAAAEAVLRPFAAAAECCYDDEADSVPVICWVSNGRDIHITNGDLRAAAAHLGQRASEPVKPVCRDCGGLGGYMAPNATRDDADPVPCQRCNTTGHEEEASAAEPDPLGVECPRCRVGAGTRCIVWCDHEPFWLAGYHPERDARAKGEKP